MRRVNSLGDSVDFLQAHVVEPLSADDSVGVLASCLVGWLDVGWLVDGSLTVLIVVWLPGEGMRYGVLLFKRVL